MRLPVWGVLFFTKKRGEFKILNVQFVDICSWFVFENAKKFVKMYLFWRKFMIFTAIFCRNG